MGFTPLHWAVKNGDVEMVNVLLKYNPNINQQDYFLRSPLYLAVKYGRVKMVQLLLVNKANASIRSIANVSSLDVCNKKIADYTSKVLS